MHFSSFLMLQRIKWSTGSLVWSVIINLISLFFHLLFSALYFYSFRKKNSKILKCIRLLELLHKEKSFFKGKECAKALKIMENQGHRVGFGTQQFVFLQQCVHRVGSFAKAHCRGKIMGSQTGLVWKDLKAHLILFK